MASNLLDLLSLHLAGLIHTSPPADWPIGSKAIVIIPGFHEPWNFLQYLADPLHAQGYAIHFPPQLDHMLSPIADLSHLVETYVLDHHLTDFVILAHSKGGLVAKHLLYHSPVSDRIRQIISIDTPYAGTPRAHLRIHNLHELLPHSPTLSMINTPKHLEHKIINLIPTNSHYKSDLVSNLTVPVPGHISILLSPLTLAQINSLLDSWK